MYVKKDDNMKQVLYDPGVGTLDEGTYFRGWTEDQNYTAETKPLTIQDVRDNVTNILAREITDGDEVTYYAMLFKSYRITYYDENGISLGEDEISFRADSEDSEQNYTINRVYTVGDNEHHFEGWHVNKGGSNIVGWVEKKVYPNETEITITGSIELGADAPAGHWLVFDENGKGAKYNAPQFIEDGEVTVEPARAEMKRFGYTFGGWFTDKAVADQPSGGTEFEFGKTLNDFTTLYARWISETRADYTVIIWKQNVAGDGYDYYTSVPVKNAVVDTTPDAVTTSGSGNGAYATINGIAYRAGSTDATIKKDFTGFHFDNTDQASKEVTTEGNTVVNVYYNRNEVTFNFYTYGYTYTPTTDNSGTQYGLVDGEYVRLTRSGNNPNYTWSYGTGSYGYVYTPTTSTSNWDTQYGLVDGEYVSLTRHNRGSLLHPDYYWTYNDSWNGEGPTYTGTRYTRNWEEIRNDYNGTRYTRSNQDWHLYKTMNGLYGSTLADNNYTWPTEYDWYEGGYSDGDTYGTQTTFLDAFIIPSGADVENFYGKTAQTGNSKVEFYKQKPDKSGYELANDVSTNVSSPSFSISDKYNGFTADHYTINGTTVQLSEKDADGYYARKIGYGGTTLRIYFNRQSFPLAFMNGSYYSGNDVLESTVPGKLRDSDITVTYGADLSSYNEGGNDYFVPEKVTGYTDYTFAGWYLDDKCTQPCEFTTMPEGGLTVYAKWIKTQYRAFLHPNYPEAATGDIDWGTSQEMTFRISSGEKLSAPTGRLTGYDFVGWFTDEDCTHGFNSEAFVFNDDTVTTPYDKTKDMTDPYDPNGNLGPEPYNSDITGYKGGDRFWITKKLDIYGKWRKHLDGASGIGVVYDANGGSNPPSDKKTYLDGASTSAGAASTAPPKQSEQDKEKKFGYWVLQTWNDSEGKYVDTDTHLFPGDPFTVNASDAKVETITPAEGSTDTKKYTVQLRAEYIDSEEPTPTHIWWYPNYGDNTPDKQNTLEDNTEAATFAINQAVKIKAPLSRAGYDFIGWAKDKEDGRIHEFTKDSSEMFLWYDVATKKYYTDKTFTKPATYIAADEDNPYDAMYAVWEKAFVTLSVTKALDGDLSYVTIPNAGFEIKVTLTGGNITPDDVITKPEDAVDIDGSEGSVVATLRIKTTSKKEAKSISIEIPKGVKYSVKEEKYEGFNEPAYSGDNQSGTTENANINVTVTNEAQKVTETGVNLDTTAAKTALLSLFAFAMMCVLGFSLKRRYVSRR